MKNSIILFLLTLLFTGSTPPAQSGGKMYEVRVEARINNCLTKHDVIVEAKNLHEAKEKARRVVQAKLTTKAPRAKQIR